MTPTQAMLDDVTQFVKLDRRKALVNYYGVAHLGGGGQGSTGRGPTPSGTGEDRPGEGVPRKPFAVDDEAGRNTSAPDAVAEPVVTHLIYVSLYGEHKNLSTLLKAIPFLNRNGVGKFLLKTTMDPSWEFVSGMVTCEGDRALTQGPEVSPWIQIVGPVGGEAVLGLYPEGDIFVFPALCESFGQPMAEAMAHGLPIVASDTPVNREVCADAAVYFSPLSAEELACQVKAVAQDPALMRKLGAAGRERAATVFRWDRHVQRILQYAGDAKEEAPQPCGDKAQ
jgi:glycosyltransferase involved in cell wall biosynthesis